MLAFLRFWKVWRVRAPGGLNDSFPPLLLPISLRRVADYDHKTEDVHEYDIHEC